MFGGDVFSVSFCLFIKGIRWTLPVLLMTSVESIWMLSVRGSFTYSVFSAGVSFFLPSGSLTLEITRQGRLEYCLKRSTSLTSSSLVRFNETVSLCHSWTSCSKLFRRFDRFLIFWSWSWIIDINLSLGCCCDLCLLVRWWYRCIILGFDVASFISIWSFASGHLYFDFLR